MIESEESMENDLEACTLILENRLDNMQQKCALHIWEGGGPNGQKETILCLNVLVLPKNVNFISFIEKKILDCLIWYLIGKKPVVWEHWGMGKSVFYFVQLKIIDQRIAVFPLLRQTGESSVSMCCFHLRIIF